MPGVSAAMAVMILVFETIFRSAPLIWVTEPVNDSLFLFTKPVTTTSLMVCESDSRNTFSLSSPLLFELNVCVTSPRYDTLISKSPLGMLILNFPSTSDTVPVKSLSPW